MLPFGMNDVESDPSEPELEAHDQSDSMEQHSDTDVNTISDLLINEICSYLLQMALKLPLFLRQAMNSIFEKYQH